MQFRLAPAYSLYLMLRSCVSSFSRSDSSVAQHEQHIGLLANKMAHYLHQIVMVGLCQSVDNTYFVPLVASKLEAYVICSCDAPAMGYSQYHKVQLNFTTAHGCILM